MAAGARKSIRSPDETKTFDKGRCDIVRVGPVMFGRAVLEPGWRWSESGANAAAGNCTVAHSGYVVSGRVRFVAGDGSEMEVGSGDVFVAPPGHDAWVVGDKPCEMLDFATNQATYEVPFALQAAAATAPDSGFAHATANPPPMPSMPPTS